MSNSIDHDLKCFLQSWINFKKLKKSIMTINEKSINYTINKLLVEEDTLISTIHSKQPGISL